MQKRRLGEHLQISALGLGCMGMSEFYGPSDDAESLKVLQRALELGVDFFDTADMYGPYHNEELIGRFLREQQAKVRIASKFGIIRRGKAYERRIDNSPEYARQACEASLQRLGVEHIDLYYVHRIEQERPIEEVMQALSDLVAEGKIGHIGLCEAGADTLKRAHAVHPVAALQSEYSLWTRDVEDSILPTCRELNIGFVPYSPLGRGFLTGQIDNSRHLAEGDFRRMLPRFSAENLPANLSLVDTLKALAADKHCTPAQLALAWVLAKGDDIVPIPGTKRLTYLEDNCATADIPLNAEEMQHLENAVARQTVAGERYTEEGMKGVEA